MCDVELFIPGEGMPFHTPPLPCCHMRAGVTRVAAGEAVLDPSASGGVAACRAINKSALRRTLGDGERVTWRGRW